MGNADVGFTGPIICAPGVPGEEPQDSEGSLREELARQSPFVEGPQLTVASLRKENLELKAVVAKVTSRVETLERRLSRIERGDNRFVSDIRFPNPCGGNLQVPDQIERGMQIDAFQRRIAWPEPLSGAMILGR